jgi:hypothetical protein
MSVSSRGVLGYGRFRYMDEGRTSHPKQNEIEWIPSSMVVVSGVLEKEEDLWHLGLVLG